ncbi:MAG: HlyD family efflux transporter periplasmic adaptor subunit [Hyphomicrobiaceae bacterium]|nr:HlyD family efflux transporter periplasmic adaptor subunit [Hyphomicrobiaceae bacterium]
MNEFSGYVGNKNIKQARSEGKKREIKSDEYAKSGAGEANEIDAAATWRKRVFEIPSGEDDALDAPARGVGQTGSGDDAGARDSGGSFIWRPNGYKVAAASFMVLLVGVAPLMRLTVSESAQAVINARIVEIRAPIDGMMNFYPFTHVGANVSPGQELLVIDNDNADRSALDMVRRELARLKAEQTNLKDRIGLATEERKTLLDAEKVYQTARLEQFRYRQKQVLAQISAAKARELAAKGSFDRIKWLADRGLATPAHLDVKRQDNEVAKRMVAQGQNQLAEIKVEYEAAQKGIRLTDDHNTNTSVKSRAERLAFEIRDLESELRKREQLIYTLKVDLEREQERYGEAIRRLVTTPISGQIWEKITASGEFVKRGQPLLSVLDCSNAVVSASVSEATYNTLKVGDKATFRSSSDLTEYTGRIVKMHGLASPNTNLAIKPAVLRNEPFRVTVQAEEISHAEKCTVGQTGVVRFYPSDAPGVYAGLLYWLQYWVPMP